MKGIVINLLCAAAGLVGYTFAVADVSTWESIALASLVGLGSVVLGRGEERR